MDKILIFGDSISYGKWDEEGGWPARLRKYIDQKYNLGKTGSFLTYTLGIPGDLLILLSDRFGSELKNRIDPADANLVIIAAGINDSCPNNKKAGKQTSEDDFKAALRKIISISKENNCTLVFVGLTPVNPEKSKGLLFSNDEVRRFDEYISDVCREQDIFKVEQFEELLSSGFANLLVDSVHPDSNGHKILFEKINSFISQKWGI